MRDVIVVGGGPAGLRFAERIAAAGFDSVVLDDRVEIGRSKICAGIIGSEAFQELGLPRESIMNRIQRLKFLSPQDRVVDYTHPELLAYVVDRAAFDRSLARTAAAAGVEIQAGRRVGSVKVESDRVSVEIEAVEGSDEPRGLEARLLVIATGVNARFNNAVGLGRPTAFLNAVQAHVRVRKLECTHCFAGRSVAQGAFAWMVPLANGWARVGLMTDGRSSRFFDRFLKRIAPFRADTGEIQPDFKPIVQRFSGSSFADRVLAVGEAAGQVKTTTGGGIYYGLLGADIAAEVAAEALRRDRPDRAFLAPYESRWKDRIAPEIDAGYVYRKALSQLSDPQIEALFQLARVNGILPLIRRKARFDWHLEVLTSLVRHGTVRRVLGLDLLPAEVLVSQSVTLT